MNAPNFQPASGAAPVFIPAGGKYTPPSSPAPQQPTQPTTSGIDPDVKALTIAIGRHENGTNYERPGKSGEVGRYQFTNWSGWAQKYLGDSNASLSPENQNKVAYARVKELKDQGLGPAEIASTWNSGQKDAYRNNHRGVNKFGVSYDTPAYVNSVIANYRQIKQTMPKAAPLGVPVAQAAEIPPGGDQQQLQEEQLTPSQEADKRSKEETGATFGAEVGKDTMLSAGLKTLGNVPSSALTFGKGILDFLNPINTAKKVASLPGEFQGLVQDKNAEAQAKNNDYGRDYSGTFDKFGGIPALNSAILETPGAAYRSMVPEAARGLVTAGGGLITGNDKNIDEGLATAQRALTNDPVGSIAPFIFMGDTLARRADVKATAKANTGLGEAGGFEKAGPPRPPITAATDKFNNTMSSIAKPVTNVASKIFGAPGKAAGGLGKFFTAKATGFDPSTIDTIEQNRAAFNRVARADVDRASLAQPVEEALQGRIDDLKETGKGYKAIRDLQSPTTGQPTQVPVPTNYFAQTIKETTGLNIVDGKLQASGTSKIREAKDVRALQSLYDLWQPEFQKGQVSPTEFLNFRSDLAGISRFERDIGSSAPLEDLAAVMRGKFNDTFRGKIDGLEALDTDYAKQITELQELKKGLIDKDGNLTDSAINRIANAGGKGKDAQLARLEQITPGITNKIKILKAIEDIQHVHKVGTYGKAVVEGGGLVTGIATGNIPMIAASIAGMILASPEMATSIIQKYGATKEIVQAVTKLLRKGGAMINNAPAKIPLPFAPTEKNQ